MVNEVDAIEVAGAQLGDLADSATDRVLVTRTARCGIVERPETFVTIFDFVEGGAVSVELGLGRGPVSQVVEAGRGLCNGLTENGFVYVKRGTDPHYKEYNNYKLQ